LRSDLVCHAFSDVRIVRSIMDSSAKNVRKITFLICVLCKDTHFPHFKHHDLHKKCSGMGKKSDKQHQTAHF